jgi:hypothetical protein
VNAQSNNRKTRMHMRICAGMRTACGEQSEVGVTDHVD